MKQRFVVVLAVLAVLAGLSLAKAATPTPVRAALPTGVTVYVGYADGLRGSSPLFPIPWNGSAGVTSFQGCGSCSDIDAGAVRVINNSTSAITVNSLDVQVGTGCDFTNGNTGWASNIFVPVFGQVIFTAFLGGGTSGCVTDGHMDTSDVPSATFCGQSGIIPQVTVTVNGSPTTSADSGQILNTGGQDKADCVGGNESTQWVPIGGSPCSGATLTLAPPTQTHIANGSDNAKVTATLTNGTGTGCGQGLQGEQIAFTVTTGPNAGTTGTGVTDVNGQATFSYSSTLNGTDTVQASAVSGSITSNTVTVNWDAPITVKGTNISATEGTAFNGQVATFNDPDDQASTTDTAKIDWGDGTPATNGTVAANGNGNYTVTGTHTYAEDGSYSVTVTITDGDNASNTATTKPPATATVAEGDLTVGTPAFAATEGTAYTGQVTTFKDGTNADPASNYTATIDWGDGSPTSAGVVSQPSAGAPYVVSAPAGGHSYADEGPETVKVTVTETGITNGTASNSGTVKVADAALSSTFAGPAVSLQAFSGPVAKLSDANTTTSSVADFTVAPGSTTIDWGDGSPVSNGTVTSNGGGNYTISGTHTYASTGNFTITVNVLDDGGQKTSASGTVLIFAFAPGGGAFVVGNNSDTGSVTFWGAQWANQNSLSGGSAPNAFKGFENGNKTPSCGGTYTTDPGNSAGPPAGPLPAYMGVIVSSSVTKSGSTISGDIKQIIVVQTNSGYSNDPGHAGTGTVVATFCS